MATNGVSSNRQVQAEVIGIADHAEEFLDNLVVTGVRDDETVTIDLLRRRLDQMEAVARSPELRSVPDQDSMYQAIIRARREIEADERFARAARLR